MTAAMMRSVINRLASFIVDEKVFCEYANRARSFQ
jgi:hypothetical protein